MFKLFLLVPINKGWRIQSLGVLAMFDTSEKSKIVVISAKTANSVQTQY